ncbi:MAG: hypothetical protein ACM3KE_11665, partial [Hyphomicrobiales bacterium]
MPPKTALMKIYDHALATMEFSVAWGYDGIRHTDCLHAHRVNFWRDILPPGLCEALVEKPDVRSVPLAFQPGQVLPPPSSASVYRIRREDIEKGRFPGIEIEPHYGRFYPRGILRGVPGVFRENFQPFRCTGLEPEQILADFNHPLSGKGLAVDVTVQ